MSQIINLTPSIRITKTPEQLIINEREETLQFIAKPPGWFLRFGISVIAMALAILIIMSYFIKYPDIVVAKVILTTENPPIRIVSKSTGKVMALLAKNNSIVKINDILCILENAANYQDVLNLEKHLKTENVNFLVPITNLKLGNLQNLYSTYSQNLKDYNYFLARNGVLNKIQFLKTQIDNGKKLNDNLQAQKLIQSKELEFGERDFARQKQLHNDGIVSDADFEKANAQLLLQKRQVEQNDALFINNSITQTQYETQINDLLQSKDENLNAKLRTVTEDARRLKAGIEEWKQNYLVVAPIAGTINYSKIWSAQQAIASGEEILAVVPNDSAKIVCKAILPIAQSGKVKTGLSAQIRIDAYPFQQYGVLRAVVQNIAALPQKEDYQLDIALLNGLQSTYKKLIPFRQEMQGTANIITEDRSIMGRMFDKFKDLTRNR